MVFAPEKVKKFGGKGVSLYHLLLHGIPVPDFYVIISNNDYELVWDAKYHAQLLHEYHQCKRFAIRSSAPVEDSEIASFAGMNETILNVKPEEIKYAVPKVAKVPERAREYAKARGIELPERIPIIVQCMVDARYAGVAFTKDPVSGRDVYVIEVVRGLGEQLVSGRKRPTRYVISKDGQILEKQVVDGELSNEALEQLIQHLRKIEQIFGKPMDVEWAVDNNDFVWILQARPITTLKTETKTEKKISYGKVILKGIPASPGIAIGITKIILDPHSLEVKEFREGDILVVKYTDPDYLPLMKKAAAIIADEGGALSHTAIVARELGVPAVVGTGNATKMLKNGQRIVVDGLKGVVAEP